LLLGLEAYRGDHRAEDLLARDRHVVGRLGEERRLVVEAAARRPGTLAAAREPSTLPYADLHVALDAATPPPPDERTDHDARLVRVADLEPGCRRRHARGELVVGRVLDQEPRRRDADLTRVEGPDAHRGAERPLEVGVGEDDVRRLAAELHQRAL